MYDVAIKKIKIYIKHLNSNLKTFGNERLNFWLRLYCVQFYKTAPKTQVSNWKMPCILNTRATTSSLEQILKSSFPKSVLSRIDIRPSDLALTTESAGRTILNSEHTSAALIFYYVIKSSTKRW